MTDKCYRKIRQFLIWAIASLAAAPVMLFAETNHVTQIRVLKMDSATRIIINLNQSAPCRIFSLGNPDRMVIDFSKVKLGVKLNTLHFAAKEIQSIRSGHPDPDTLRLVLDVKTPASYKVISRPEDSVLILDLGPADKKNKLAAATPVKPDEKKPVAATKDHPIVIVIDPGHGGKDPGAIGEHGTEEKNVVLSIAKLLAEHINAQPNMRAVLTRNGDYFVPLRNRLKLARKGNADLFVAIHADSFFKDHSNGASVFALSQHGATTEAARWLAQRDNYSELGGVNLRGLSDQSYLLRSVLIDLAQTATITDSLRLGTAMLKNLQEVTRLHYPRVEQAPFMVLKSPDIPSILVETGFISNTDEEERLRDKKYQKEIAVALFSGIQDYLKKYSTNKI